MRSQVKSTPPPKPTQSYVTSRPIITLIFCIFISGMRAVVLLSLVATAVAMQFPARSQPWNGSPQDPASYKPPVAWTTRDAWSRQVARGPLPSKDAGRVAPAPTSGDQDAFSYEPPSSWTTKDAGNRHGWQQTTGLVPSSITKNDVTYEPPPTWTDHDASSRHDWPHRTAGLVPRSPTRDGFSYDVSASWTARDAWARQDERRP